MLQTRALALAGLLLGARMLAAEAAPTLDVPMLPPGPMPMVSVMLNGQGPFSFGIETGGHMAISLDADVAERLNLPVLAGSPMPALDGAAAGHLTRVDDINIGRFHSKGSQAFVTKIPRGGHSPHPDGLLGLHFFGENLVTLDFPGQRVRVMPGALPVPDGADVIGMRQVMGLPAIDIEIGSTKVTALFDTGNMAGAFMLPVSLVEKLQFASEPVVVGRARTVYNELELKSARLKDAIRVGRHEFPQPTVIYPAAMDMPNVGSKALGEFVVTIDSKNERLRLERSAHTVNASGPAGRINEVEGTR